MTGKLHTPFTKVRWHGSQRRIGLTGGIASGKSSVGKFLQESKSLPLIDADQYAHQELEPGKNCTIAVIERYGKEVTNYDQDNSIGVNRSALGQIIFSDTKERKWLESLIHPLVKDRLQKELLLMKNEPTIVLMIPLLFEVNLTNMCGEIWVVDCLLEQQYKRLMKRDGLSKIEAQERINAQWPLEEKKKLADIIIDNTGDIKEWENFINEIL